ncbi:hypothetical protein [Nocardiopsis rhodophaea]|uniref:hypothetical protein n=1 Tax=Nocardiopsis rhodophaea TaxID=280238 RepID=UPI0031D12EAA
MVDPDVDLWKRIGATDQLVAMGPQARSVALEALLQMNEEWGDTLQRALARSRAAPLDGRYASEAYEKLTAVVADTGLLPWERQCAASSLLRLGRQHLDRAAELLTMLAEDMDHTLGERRQACEALARLGAVHRDRAVALLAEYATKGEGRACSWEIGETADTLAELDPGRAAEADALLLSLGKDEAYGFDERAHILKLLIRWGSSVTAEAMELLLRITASSDANTINRIGVLSDLTQRERSRTRALGRLRDISHDPKVSETDRLEAAPVLFKNDRELREPVLCSLRETARDPLRGACGRSKVADLLIGQGPDEHRLAMSVLTSCARDTRAP